MSAKILSPYQI